jgi:hypothetical protein
MQTKIESSSSLFSSSASTSSSSSEIKITIKKENDNPKIIVDSNENKKTNVQSFTSTTTTTTSKSSKKKKNKKKKNKLNQIEQQTISTQQQQQQLSLPPPPPPQITTENLISELKSDNNNNMNNQKIPDTHKCCNIHHHHITNEIEDTNNNNDIESDYEIEDEEEIEDDENDEESDQDEEEEEEDEEDESSTVDNITLTSTGTTTEVAVSTIAANIENLTSAFIPKDDTPENKNLREKLKNIVSSLQSLQKVIDTQDLKMYTKLSTSKTCDGESNKCLENEDNNNNTAHAIITANFISNIEKLMSNNGSTSGAEGAISLDNSAAVYDCRIKNATLELSSCELKKSHDSILSELIETRNEINNARNRKLLKHQQYYQQLTQNNELNPSIIDHLNDLKTITLSTCMSHIEDFKINYKLLANNHELVLDEEGKLAIKNQHNELLSNIDNVQTLSTLASETLKNYKQIEIQRQSELIEKHEEEQQQGKNKNNNSNNKTKVVKQVEKKDSSCSSSGSSSNSNKSKSVDLVKEPVVVVVEVKKNVNKKKKASKNSVKVATISQMVVNNEKQHQQKDINAKNAKNTKTAVETVVINSQPIPIIKLPVEQKHIKQNNLSDLDSFSLDSISSSVDSLVVSTSDGLGELIENDVVVVITPNNNNNNQEAMSENDDGGDWIQVKKPARNSSSINIISNEKLNQKTSDLNVSHKNEIKVMTKSVSHGK